MACGLREGTLGAGLAVPDQSRSGGGEYLAALHAADHRRVAIPLHARIPTRFLVTNDVIPNLIGVPETWDDVPQTAQTMGQALTNQTVVLSNQPCAHLVYTALMTYSDQWDPLFTEACVALLASRVALRLVPDPKQRIAIRDEQIKIAQMALSQARV